METSASGLGKKNLMQEIRFHFKMLNCTLLIDEWSPQDLTFLPPVDI